MAVRTRRFTIYDAMEDKGVFEQNPANTSSPQYAGPVEYPKMFYHPTGEERVMIPAEIVVTPMGPKEVGEQRILVTRLANNAEEEAALRDAGWHDHPADSIAASGRAAPAKASPARVADIDREIARLQAEKARAEKALGMAPIKVPANQRIADDDVD